jgi:hypothetical protein
MHSERKKLSTRVFFVVSPQGPEYVWTGPVFTIFPPQKKNITTIKKYCYTGGR